MNSRETVVIRPTESESFGQCLSEMRLSVCVEFVIVSVSVCSSLFQTGFGHLSDSRGR